MWESLLQNIPEILFYNNQQPVVYNSVFFIVLFTGFYFLYALSFRNIKLRNLLLLFFSLYFYYKLSGLYVFLLVFIATSDFFIGKAIYRAKKDIYKSIYVLLAVLINISSLLYFKYAVFFNNLRVDIINNYFNANLSYEVPEFLNVIMPIGISFYIFKTLSYIFDLKRELIEKPENNYINYLLFVSFFPNILAGPISKARNLLPQLSQKVFIDKTKLGNALFLIICGVFKKIVIADFLGRNFVDRVFDAPEFFTNFETLMAAYGYTMQLYFDFSGYTDIVIGIALLLGFNIETNFNKPFLAQNITDFWRRWHITLSSWLNDYIFKPLSLSFRKFKTFGVAVAVLITFCISGLWHGPAVTYIIWGTLHGLALAWDISSSNLRKKLSQKINNKIYSFFSILITFHFLVFSMIIFKTESLAKSILMFKKIFAGLEYDLILNWAEFYILPLCVLIISIILHYLSIDFVNRIKNKFSNLHWGFQIIILFIAILFIFQTYNSDSQPFIYLKY